MRRQLPHACNRQCVCHVLHNGHEDKNPRDARQDQIDEHEKLAQPAQDPVALEVVDEGEQGGDVGSGRQQRQHPDDEEVVRHHGLHFG